MFFFSFFGFQKEISPNTCFYYETRNLCILVASPQARLTPSPTSPTPYRGPIGAENYQNLETSTIQGENWFWNGSQLIDRLGIFEMSRDW